jgi:hypothetical protein
MALDNLEGLSPVLPGLLAPAGLQARPGGPPPSTEEFKGARSGERMKAQTLCLQPSDPCEIGLPARLQEWS